MIKKITLNLYFYNYRLNEFDIRELASKEKIFFITFQQTFIEMKSFTHITSKIPIKDYVNIF